jgi:hypothetical protein
MKPMSILGAALCLGIFQGIAVAQDSPYWGEWQKHPSENYYSRNFYFKPNNAAGSYRHHKAFWLPGSRSFYYYNPYTKKVWGRCSTFAKQQNQYFKLPPEKQIDIEGPRMVIIKLQGDNNNVNVNGNFQGIQGGNFSPPGLPDEVVDPTVIMGAPPDDPPIGQVFPGI